jgi:hypothetical protein
MSKLLLEFLKWPPLPWKRPKCQKVEKHKNDHSTLQSNSGRHPTPLFWYLGLHGNVILNFINTPKASTRYGEYSNDVS